MSNFRMNQGGSSHNTPPPSPHVPRNPNNNCSPSSPSSTSSNSSSLMNRRRRTRNNAALDKKLEQMALPLAPLVQLTSGQIHPAFPATLLGFWLLTGDQLEELAQFYHQRTLCEWTRHYPCPITWAEGLTLEEKRRKIGKFIGLKGCHTPMFLKTEEQIMAEARHVRAQEDGDEALRRKTTWYH